MIPVMQINFWIWSLLTEQDVNQQLREACNAYEQHFGQQPFIVFCSQGTKAGLHPIEGLHVEPTGLVADGLLYFSKPRNRKSAPG